MNYIDKILSKIKEQKISKTHGITLLIDFFYNSEDLKTRIYTLQALDAILPDNQKSFDFLENLLISDENAKIRAKAVHLLVKFFPKWGLHSFKWVIDNETSPLVLQELFQLIKTRTGPPISILQNKLTEWFKTFGNKLRLHPSESRFILDLEALFEKQEPSTYHLNEDTYTFYEFLRGLDTPTDWFLAEKGDIIELRFNYDKWKYLKDYQGNRNRLKQYRDLDLLLSLLLRGRLEKKRSVRLPQSISLLTHLEKLDISENNLTTIPSSLNNLDSLKYLNLSHNNLKSVPEVIFSMNNLKYLDLSYNQIKTIPPSIKALKNLTTLRIKGNIIQSVPSFLQNFQLDWD